MMGRGYTPGQKKATYKYMEDKAVLRATMSKEKAEKVKAYAKPSVSAYINRLIDEDMAKKKDSTKKL